MSSLCQLVSVIWMLCMRMIYADKGSIVVFGGNGFVGRRICEQGIARSYRVISISRSGCPEAWKSSEWSKKVEWYQADALNVESFKDYITKQKPIAIFTMMGTATVKQMYRSVAQIFEYAGTTNINVCNVAANIESVQKFVYIGAPVTEIGINPLNANNSYALWTQLWIGQYYAKLAMEKCVDEKFGENGITFRPNVVAGVQKKHFFFGGAVEFNRVPFYESEGLRKFYKFIAPSIMSATELANDALDFIENKDSAQFKCVSHSKKAIVQPIEAGVSKIVMENLDNIILAIISVVAIFFVYSIIKCIN